jgi:hypothetical protein
MSFVNNPPMCPICEGAGLVFEDIEDLSEITSKYPRGKRCKLCKRSGIDLRLHDVEFYKGELVYYNKGPVRIGMFIEEATRTTSLIALGSEVLRVDNEFITFVNLIPANPQKNMYRFQNMDHIL